jgi:DNA-binding phage protein
VSDLLQRWVERYGGPDKLAVELGVSSLTVRFWLKRRGYPQVDTMRRVVELSGGHLSYDDIIVSCHPEDGPGKGETLC